MKCDDPRCTGNHNDRKWETLCPRTKEDKLARDRRAYDESSWHARHLHQLRVRRLKALQRIETRRLSG